MPQKIMPLDIPWVDQASFLDKGWQHELQACQGQVGEVQFLYNNLLDASPRATKWIFKYPNEFKYPHTTYQTVWFRGQGETFGSKPSQLSAQPLKRVDGQTTVEATYTYNNLPYFIWIYSTESPIKTFTFPSQPSNYNFTVELYETNTLLESVTAPIHICADYIKTGTLAVEPFLDWNK